MSRTMLGLCLGLLSGCLPLRSQIDPAMLARHAGESRRGEPAEPYRVSCPDILAVTLAGVPGWQDRRVQVEVDGRIDLGDAGRVRIEGQTIPEVWQTVANRFQLTDSEVQVRVADYRSQQVYVIGEVNGEQRAVPFRGEETVVELLQRAGGITSGAATNEIYIIRGNVADGERPQVFSVKLRDIVLHNDHRTNLTIEPFDQVYISETRRSALSRCIPPILRPIYDSLSGLYRKQTAGTAGTEFIGERGQSWPRSIPPER